MNRYALLFVGLGLASTLLEAEDLGQKINSYAVKDGKKVWEEDRFGNRTEFEYDRAGQLVNTRRSGMSVSGNVYKNGLLKEQRTISGAIVKMNYDAQGCLIEKLTSGGKTEQKYDKYGRMIERHGASDYPLKFNYTGWGELAGYTDGNGSTTRFNYDKSGKLTKRIWPDGTPVKYGYANGRLVSKEEAGRKTTYQYDTFGRMVEEKIVQGKESLTTKMTYDENGRMSSITDGKTTVKFAYDRFGRKLLEDGPVGTITMMYDEKGRLSARQVQFKGKNEKFTTEYKYDEYDRVVTVKSPSGEFHYTWTKDNKIATQSIGDKKVVNTYDKAGRLISKTFGDTVLAKYEYDSLDRRIKGQYFDVKWNYTYDQHNQLIEARNSKGDSYTYEYDLIGNRLKAVENGKICKFTYNNLNQMVNNGYEYDAWGNMIKTPEAEYKYDLKNRLIEVKKKDGTIVTYEYDPLAQRIASNVNDKDNTTFLTSGMIEYARRNSDNPQYHTLGLDLLGTLEQTGAIGNILATNEMQYLYDGNGNVNASVKNNAIADKLTYEPFGKQTAGKVLAFTFSSKPVDQSDMSYYGYRFYNISTASWEKRDVIENADFHFLVLWSIAYIHLNKSNFLLPNNIPSTAYSLLGKELNTYSFSFNNPVDNMDYLGCATRACNAAENIACNQNCNAQGGFSKTCTVTEYSIFGIQCYYSMSCPCYERCNILHIGTPSAGGGYPYTVFCPVSGRTTTTTADGGRKVGETIDVQLP